MHTSSLFFGLALFFLWTSSNVNTTAHKLHRGFSIDLIHRDSPLSPLYNSSMTHSERFQNAAVRSRVRANRFGQSSMAETSELVETDIFPNEANYLMKISIGTPPVERWATADTGSDLIWFQCSPCPQCNPQNEPLFDPKSSSTYVTLPCTSNPCEVLPRNNGYPICGTSNECTYYYSYGDESYTMGELANESISFGASGSGQPVSFPYTVFGCGHNNNATDGDSDTGLVGFGQGALSLVSQMAEVGRRFSYCFPPMSYQSTTKLRFGDEATISGNGVVSTPLITRHGSPYYFLNLEGMTVGDQKVSLTSQRNGNMFIDSGTTFTMLPSSFYDQVEASVRKAIGAGELIERNSDKDLCYKNANSIKNIPNFVVHFKGADLSLKPQNFFRFISDNVMCFTMNPTKRLPIYGNLAQIDFEVEHDLDQKKISFAPADCTKQ